MPMFTTLRTRLPVCPVHAPDRTRSLKSAILRSTACTTSGTTFSPSTSMTAPSGARSATCKHRAVLGDVDLLAAEHRVDPVSQPGARASSSNKRTVSSVIRFFE